MTDLTMQGTRDDVSGLLGVLLRQRTSSGKDLANRIGVDPRTADGYRAGRFLPTLPVFIRMVRALGADLAEAVIDPAAAEARLNQEIARHEAAAAEARRIREALGGDRGGVQGLRDALASSNRSLTRNTGADAERAP